MVLTRFFLSDLCKIYLLFLFLSTPYFFGSSTLSVWSQKCAARDSNNSHNFIIFDNSIQDVVIMVKVLNLLSTPLFSEFFHSVLDPLHMSTHFIPHTIGRSCKLINCISFTVITIALHCANQYISEGCLVEVHQWTSWNRDKC